MPILLSWLMVGLYFIFVKSNKTYSIWPGNSVVILALLTGIKTFNFFWSILIGIVISLPLIIGFLTVGYQRLNYQGLTRFNMFFVALAGAAIIIPIMNFLFSSYHVSFPLWEWLMRSYYFTAIYLMLDFIHLLSTYVYYQICSWRSKVGSGPIVVLGCGLFNQTELSPTLMMRVQGAIDYRSERNLLIMSGGQGPDEAVPEACAMKEYALNQGVPDHFIQIEAQSTTTYENLKNTKKLLQLEQSNLLYIVSSNYHLPRALYYAEQLNLTGIGLYTKSPLRLWCGMFFREWVAFIVLRYRWHLILFPTLGIFYIYYFLANI